MHLFPQSGQFSLHSSLFPYHPPSCWFILYIYCKDLSECNLIAVREKKPMKGKLYFLLSPAISTREHLTPETFLYLLIEEGIHVPSPLPSCTFTCIFHFGHLISMLLTVDCSIIWFYPCNTLMNQEMSLY